MSREPMGHADAAWLRMDSPTNLMVVNSILWFDGPLDPEALNSVLSERLVARFRRFRQRVVEDQGIWWEDDPDFDLSRHLHRLELPPPRGRRELEALVGSYLTVLLDPTRPLWDLYVIDDYDGGTALFFRMHHCIADGIALTRVLLSLTDEGEEYAGVVAESSGADRPSLWSLASGLAHEAFSVAVHPRQAAYLAGTAISDARALATLVALPPDAQFWGRQTSTDKVVIWSDPIPLESIKQAGHASGTTVNDVILAAVTGALRTDRDRRGATIRDLRVVVPFNLRALDQPLPSGLGNRFGLVFLHLPLTRETPARRLEEMAHRMLALKRSAEGVVSYGVLDVVGRAPTVVEKAVVEIFASKGSAVMTNVAGPREPVTLAGSRLRGTIGWVPMSGSIGLGVSIFSYAGDVVIGLVADRLQVANAHLLMEDILAELQTLVTAFVPA